MFSLIRALPSPTSAEDTSSLFGWFIGTVAQSDSSEASMPALWLFTFSGRPRSEFDRGTPEASRFSCMLFLSVLGFLDYAGLTVHSRLTWLSFCLPQLGKSRHPERSSFRSSIVQAH